MRTLWRRQYYGTWGGGVGDTRQPNEDGLRGDGDDKKHLGFEDTET